MRFNSTRQKFRQINQIAPPTIDYFEKTIQSTKKYKPRKKKTSFTDRRNYKVKALEESLGQMREEMQYALVMADR